MRHAQVMIVEDEALVGIDIKNNLRKYGYNVVGISSSGEDAIQSAIKNKPEIALMDIKLKGEMDGIETAKYLQKTLNIPTIYLTAFSDDITLTKALKANPYGYLLKPFVPMELHTTIQTALYKFEDEKNTKSENNFQRVKYISQNHFKCKEFEILSKEKKKVLKDEKCHMCHFKYIP